jgi:hypothetical protein
MNRATVIGLSAGATALALLVAVILVIDATRKDTIADGVQLGSVDVGGLQRNQARALVQRKLAGTVGGRSRRRMVDSASSWGPG